MSVTVWPEAYVQCLPAVQWGCAHSGCFIVCRAGGQSGEQSYFPGSALYRRQLALVSVTSFEPHSDQNLI